MKNLLDEIMEMDSMNENSHESGCKCTQCSKVNDIAHSRSCGCKKCRMTGFSSSHGSILDELLFELDNNQIASAVDFNNKSSKTVGWSAYIGEILGLLGLTWVHNDLAFAEAVADWQSRNGLKADGWLGKNTWKKMKTILGSSSSGNNSTNNSGADRISTAGLSWAASDPFPKSFKIAVYNRAIENGKSKGRTFIPTLPSNSITSIQNGKYLRKDAAIQLKRLIDEANAAISLERKNIKIKVSSGYRSATTQFNLWNDRFKGYYERAIRERVIKPNDYGNDSVIKLAKFIGSKTAAPGYSNHQNGLAVDFTVTDINGRALTHNSTLSSPIANWKENWFWKWLNKNASLFKFYPYLKEPWHWEYRG